MTMAQRTKKWSKAPSHEEIAAFDGMHCRRLYSEALAKQWRCPSCNRSPQELIRWSEITGQYYRATYGDEHGMGWTISLVRHHCHSTGEHIALAAKDSRFPPTMICGDCNSADGAVKRKLGLPTSFSFSPQEIGLFVTGKPHRGVVIDFEKAALIATRVLGEVAA